MKISIADQVRLLELSESQTALDGLEARRHALPERTELTKLLAQRAAHRSSAAQSTVTAGDLGVNIRRREADMNKLKQRLKADRAALGAVEDKERRKDLEHDVAQTVRRIRDIERDISHVKNMQKAHGINSENGLDQFDEEVALAKQKLVDAERDLRARIDTITARMESMRAGIAGPALRVYDRLKTENGIPVARLDGRTCCSCFMELDNVTIGEFNAAPADAVMQCPECNAIVVRPATLEAAGRAANEE